MQLAPNGASKEALDALVGLPTDLRAFLEQHDGGRGKVGTRPLILWSADQIAREAQSQEVSLSTPGLLCSAPMAAPKATDTSRGCGSAATGASR